MRDKVVEFTYNQPIIYDNNVLPYQMFPAEIGIW